MAILRKGYAKPSFAADSAERRRRIWPGTFLTANLPPIIAAARIGSVGVRHAEMTNVDMKLRLGNNAFMIPVNQRHEMPGLDV